MVIEYEARKTDPEIQKLPTLDILLAFEDYNRVREREFEEQMGSARVGKNRNERKTREGFKVSVALIFHSTTLTHDHVRLQALLRELVDQDKVKSDTKWETAYSLFKDDKRYTDILGGPGSGPPRFFCNIIDVTDQRLEGKIEIAEGVAKRYNEKH